MAVFRFGGINLESNIESHRSHWSVVTKAKSHGITIRPREMETTHMHRAAVVKHHTTDLAIKWKAQLGFDQIIIGVGLSVLMILSLVVPSFHPPSPSLGMRSLADDWSKPRTE
ncbi:hypothetical protein NLN62_02380 [Bradyrhizobium sp. CCGUVB23]|nr:hypothetical protein [Bradyrhizobium sp. CCGUVB23]MCP3459251.1 hypothetical protein [Bradyrhizobium sp. CCGUVB23]